MSVIAIMKVPVVLRAVALLLLLLAVFPLGANGAWLASISVQARRFQLQSSPWYEVVVGSAFSR